MFFFASKILWALVQPLTFLALLFFLGLANYRRVWGRKLVVLAALLFISCGFLPIGPLLVSALEGRAEIPQTLPKRVDGIIVLGGAINAESSNLLNQPQFNENAERVFEMLRLSRTYPQAKIVYSGGSGSLHGQGADESAVMRQTLTDIGFPVENFIFEGKSRTTYENAVNSKALVSPQAGENWLLITSAFHIPRSRAVFEKQGWSVIPYPAGFIENGKIEPWQILDVSGNYWKLNIAAREIMGIIAYRLSGRI